MEEIGKCSACGGPFPRSESVCPNCGAFGKDSFIAAGVEADEQPVVEQQPSTQTVGTVTWPGKDYGVSVEGPGRIRRYSPWILAVAIILVGFALTDGGLPSVCLTIGLAITASNLYRWSYASRAREPRPRNLFLYLAIGGFLICCFAILEVWIFLGHWAAAYRSERIQGAEVHSETSARLCQMLIEASKDGKDSNVSFLVRAGAQVNCRGFYELEQDDCQVTPLIAAARSGNKSTVLLLLGLGADPSISNCIGETPLDVARSELQEHPEDSERYEEVIRALSLRD